MSRAKHLLRTASEFNQLLYNSEKASSDGCAFIKESQWVCELHTRNSLHSILTKPMDFLEN